MNIDVIISANHINTEKLAGKNVVVIDVLRATSVMVTALNKGAIHIVPFSSPEELMEFAKDEPGFIMAGERRVVKIPGFHLGNSPLEFDSSVQGKAIAMTTTNGTKALIKSNKADNVYIGSFLNAEAVAERLATDNKDIVLICSGTNGAFSLDDALCAAYIIRQVQAKLPLILTDLAQAHLKMYDESNDLHEQLKDCKHYKLLKDAGFKNDLNYCLQLNVLNIVPEWNGSEVRI